MRHEDIKNLQAPLFPAPPEIKFRFYDFVSRQWIGFSHADAHRMDYDTACRMIPQNEIVQRRIAFLVYDNKPEISPFEAVLVILLNSGA